MYNYGYKGDRQIKKFKTRHLSTIPEYNNKFLLIVCLYKGRYIIYEEEKNNISNGIYSIGSKHNCLFLQSNSET